MAGDDELRALQAFGIGINNDVPWNVIRPCQDHAFAAEGASLARAVRLMAAWDAAPQPAGCRQSNFLHE